MSRTFRSVNLGILCPARCAVAGLRRLKGKEGQNLVEYALILIVFLMLLFGIAEFGHMLYAYHFVNHAAKSAVRWAAVNGNTCGPNVIAGTPVDGSCNGSGGMNNGPASSSDIANYVTNIAPPGIASSNISTTAAWPVQANSPPICSAAVNGVGGPFPNYPGCTVEVTVSYDFNFIFPYVSTNPITLTSTSEMVIAH
jgi:Flp pilus assembly protein TadG